MTAKKKLDEPMNEPELKPCCGEVCPAKCGCDCHKAPEGLMEPKTQNYKEAVQEMDALAYAVLDCFQPGTFSQEKWLGERKADYARLHAALSSAPDEPQRDYTPEEALAEAIKRHGEGAMVCYDPGKFKHYQLYWRALTGVIQVRQEDSFRALFAEADKQESQPAKEGE